MVQQELVDAEVEASRVDLMSRWSCGECALDRAFELRAELVGNDTQDWKREGLLSCLCDTIHAVERSFHRSQVWASGWIDRATDVLNEDCDNETHEPSEWDDFSFSQNYCEPSFPVNLVVIGFWLARSGLMSNVEQVTESLLASFGLRMPVGRRAMRLSDYGCKSDHTTVISFPSFTPTGQQFHARTLTEPDESSIATASENSAIINVPTNIFSLPKNANTRFHQLLKAYRIKPVDLSTNGLDGAPRPSDASSSPTPHNPTTKGSNAAKLAAGSPRWMLCSSIVIFD